MAMSKSSASLINCSLIPVTQIKKGALFFKVNFSSYALLFGFVTVILPLKIR